MSELLSSQPDDFFKKYEGHKVSLQQACQLNKQVLYTALDLQTVAFIKVRYDGSGDSGQIDSIEFLNSLDEPVTLTGTVKILEAQWGGEGKVRVLSLDKAVEQFFYDLLELRNPGWEINEGSFGEFEWKIRLKELMHEHNERVSDVNTSSEEVDL